ncbi:hypothetical protein NDU88_002598 [Pleurodeles waltl]|uniref:Uncharacterized protein n=1 Tax=Pleurodeles waltl TaxID=8319 RepID=A0AAV7RG10_PLEWA|nr:hypothetical protein NDU88_002598 [Pleurodeles waltl]
MHEGSYWQTSLDGHPCDVLVVVGQALRGDVFPHVVNCGRGDGANRFADVLHTDLALDDLQSPLVRGGSYQTKLLDEHLHFLVKPQGFPVVGDGTLPLCPSETPLYWQRKEACHQKADMVLVFCPQSVPHAVAHKGSPQDGVNFWHSFAPLVVGFEHHLPLHFIHLGIADE